MALYDESIGLMNIRLHLRLRSTIPALAGNSSTDNTASFRRRVTIDLSNPSSSSGRLKHITQSLDTDSIVSVEKSTLFPVGSTFSYGQDLIGYTWRKNEPMIIRHEDYIV